MEKYAFKRANYIIFPCEDAEEPYYKKWKESKYMKIKCMTILIINISTYK